jgi:hypothetical protein
VTIFVRPSDVVDAIKAIDPHIGRDRKKPWFQVAHIARRGYTLTFTASDQLTAGRYVIDIDPDASTLPDPANALDWDIIVDAGDLAAIRQMHSGLDKRTAAMPVSRFERTPAGLLLVLDERISSVYAESEYRFPDIDGLIDQTVAERGDGAPITAGSVVYLPEHLARFAKVPADSAGNLLVLYPPATGIPAALVTVGEHFIGLIMPRTASAANPVPARLRPAAPAATMPTADLPVPAYVV